MGSLVRMNYIFIYYIEIKIIYFFFNIGVCKVFYGFILFVRYLCLIFRVVCCYVNLLFICIGVFENYIFYFLKLLYVFEYKNIKIDFDIFLFFK